MEGKRQMRKKLISDSATVFFVIFIDKSFCFWILGEILETSELRHTAEYILGRKGRGRGDCMFIYMKVCVCEHGMFT